MQTNKTKKVYIVNTPKSLCIEQAIFILKNDVESRDLSVEAQEIINNYTNRILINGEKKHNFKSKSTGLFFKTVCFFGAVAAAFFIFKTIF